MAATGIPNTPVCPLLSIRNPNVNELCVGADCALFLPNVQKCSLVYIGFKALTEIQALQQRPAGPPPQRPA
jgi:hypothetical protein